MSKPKLALIPSGYKSGKVYSILPNDGTGDFDFDRASEGTRVRKDGLIEEVTNDVPRLDWLNSNCPSLLLEPQRTNAFIYSQDFSNSNWSKAQFTISSNQVTAPDGTLTASEMFETSATSGKFLHQNTSVATGNDYTVSYFIKYQNKQFIQLTGSTGFDTPYVNFDILNGEIVRNLDNVDASIENFGNGWYRISLTLEATSTTNGRILLVGIRAATSFRAESYTGNTSNSYYIWGGQMEQGTYPTSYIKTEASSVTRLKDECINGGDSDLFDITEGTFFTDVTPYKASSYKISLSDGTDANRILFIFISGSNQIRFFSSSNFTGSTVTYLDATPTTLTYNSRNKIALTFKTDEFKCYANGSLVHTDTSGYIPQTLSELNFSNRSQNNEFFEGKVHDTRVYDRVLTEAEAIELTK